MTEDLWTDRLSDYLDGELDAGERARLEDHVERCPTCAATLGELRAVVERARALQPTGPERDLWPGIASAIGAPARPALGGSAKPAPAWLEALPTPPTPRRVSFSLPQLAAASLVLAFGSALIGRYVVRAEPDAPVAAAPAVPPRAAVLVGDAAPPPGYAEELARLELALEQGRTRLDANTVRILEKNLAVIDRAIRESQEALAVDPGNRFLEEHLERAYRGKVDYLRQATAMLTWGA
jgi:anti-sigma factor RsiW